MKNRGRTRCPVSGSRGAGWYLSAEATTSKEFERDLKAFKGGFSRASKRFFRASAPQGADYA